MPDFWEVLQRADHTHGRDERGARLNEADELRRRAQAAIPRCSGCEPAP